MITLKRTDSTDPDFVTLIRQLDEYLAVINGEVHDFFDQFNKIDTIRHTVVAYDGNLPVGCGAIKEYEPGTMEVKRMFVRPECRGKKIASIVLKELEDWAAEMNYNRLILETGSYMKDAIGLYLNNQYRITENYGQYKGIEISVCFEKVV